MGSALVLGTHPRAVAARRVYVTTCLLLIAVCFAARLAYITRPGGTDMEMFVYMGKLASEGKLLGVALIDNKLPSVGLLMSVPYRALGGWWGGYGWLSFGLMAMAVASLARSAGRCWGETACWPTAVAAAAWLNFYFVVSSTFQLEHVQVCLAALGGGAALELFRKYDWRDAATLGLCAGTAALAKPTGAAVLVAGVGVLFFCIDLPIGRRLRLMAVACAAALLPIAVVMVHLTVGAGWHLLPGQIAMIRAYAAGSALDPGDLAVKALTVAAVLGLPLLFRLIIERRCARPARWLRRDLWFCGIWLAFELAGAALQGRLYAYHFLPAAAPAALLFGMIARRPRAVPLAVSVGLVVGLSVWGGLHRPAELASEARKRAIIAYLDHHAAPRPGVWMDDYPRLAVERDISPGSRVPGFFLMSNDDAAPTSLGRIMLTDFQQSRPAYIVLPAERAAFLKGATLGMRDIAESPARSAAMQRAIDTIYAYVERAYDVEAAVGGDRVWHRKQARPEPTGAKAVIGYAKGR